MEILIDISEDDYKEVLKDAYSGTPFENRVFSAIQNGTVLPKGHGRLIDADNLDDVWVAYDCNGILSRIDAPTVLEADTETFTQ